MAQLLDARGNPIERKTLAEPQTARTAALHQEYATHPARGLTPAKLHALMTNAETGDLTAQADLFDDMEERDAHILAEMGKRKRAMLTLDWRVDAPRNASAAEQTLADETHELLQDIPDFEDIVIDALSAIGHGYSCLELEWHTHAGWLMPKSVSLRPHGWFVLDRATRSELRLRGAGSMDGEALNPFGWIVHRHQAKSGYLSRGGLFRSLAWPYLFKNYAARDLAEFLEIYGLPLRLGKYPAGATPDERRTLMNAVVNIGHAAAGIIPEGMLIEFQEAAKGTHDPHIAMIEWCERTVSKAVLGQQVGNDSAKKGSLAGMSVDNEVRLDILKSDARQLQGTLTRDLIFPILALNKGLTDISRCPRLVFDVREPEDMALYADALPKLAAAGVKIPVAWAQEKLHIPAPDDGEEVLTGAAAPVAQPEPPLTKGGRGDLPPAKAALKYTAVDARTKPPKTQDALTNALDEQARPAIADLIEQVRAMVENADSLEQLRDWLLDAYEGVDSTKLQQIMALGLATAQLAGRFDVASESGTLP